MSRAADLLSGTAFKTRTPGQKVMGSEEDVVEAILDALEAPDDKHAAIRLTLVDHGKLWDLEGVRRDRDGRLLAGKIKQMVATSDYKVNLKACIGSLTRDGLYNLVMAAVWDAKSQLTRGQPGEWRPIAVAFARREATLLELVPNPRHRKMEPEAVTDAEDMERLQVYSRRPTEHQWVVVTLVWCEFTGADPYDKLASEHNNRSNPNRSFFETRQLARAPQKVLERYRLAERLHKDFMDAVYPDGFTGAPSDDEGGNEETLTPIAVPKKKRAPRKSSTPPNKVVPVVTIRGGEPVAQAFDGA